jgi:hypothetical protein
MFQFTYSVFDMFQTSSVHTQEDLYMQFYGISFMHPYKQSGRYQNVFDINLLKPTTFNIQKFSVLPTVHLCVLRVSQNKQALFLYTALTYRFL